MARVSKGDPEIKDEDDSLIMSIRLKSGRFESSIEVPLYATNEERKAFVAQWLNLMEAGIKVGSTRRAAKAKPEGMP